MSNINIVDTGEYPEKISKIIQLETNDITTTDSVLIQITGDGQPIVSNIYEKNICIPKLPYIDTDQVFLYKHLYKVCIFNDYLLDLYKDKIPTYRLNYPIETSNQTLSVKWYYSHKYKFVSIFDFQDDEIVIQDLLYTFYEASKNKDDYLLILCIKSNNQNNVVSTIDTVHKNLNIGKDKLKLILLVKPNFTTEDISAIINEADCLIICNSVYVSDFEYYYALNLNKRIISKYNLDKKYQIDLIGSHKKLINYKGYKTFYDHFNIDEMYNAFLYKKTFDYKFMNHNLTNINNIL
jgi:hypothetical protein